jgi:hypothetical protein
MISNKKFTDIYNKIINDLESLKSFYFNRYILELEFGTLNFILGELLVSILNLYNMINTIKKEHDGNNGNYEILIKSINDIRLHVNKLILLIVISFSNDEKDDEKDDFTCNNEEYNLNFFSTNKENYNTIKIINSNFKIITQNIEHIKKNNKTIIDNIKINILFNKIKNNFDTINELHSSINTTHIAQEPYITQEPSINNKPVSINNKPVSINNKPVSITNKPVSITITFKQFCSLNNKNKIKVIIKLIVDIIKNINYKEINLYNTALFTFIFFLCFY